LGWFADISLQRKVLLLLEHLSHPDNLDAVLALAQRSRAALREQQRQHQCPLPLRECSHGLLDGQQQVNSVRSLRALCERVQVDSSRLGHCWAQESMHNCSKGLRNAAAAAAAGLADGTLRLLKLMCLHVLDPSSLDVGGMINKGAFSEVLEGTVSTNSTPCFAMGPCYMAATGRDIAQVKRHALVLSTHHGVQAGTQSCSSYSLLCRHVSAVPACRQSCGCAVLQYCYGSGGRPIAAALKVMDCTEDDACSFERVYNEVRRKHTTKSTSTPLSSLRLA
jgi:hypothetical protein